MNSLRLLELASEPDPLIDPTRPEKAIVLPCGLLILGGREEAGDSSNCEDLFIQIMNDELILFWRDPADAFAEDPLWGRDWTFTATFNNFEDLHSFVYTL